MTYQTDNRLRDYLDTNQLSRERLCLAMLQLDKRYTNIRARHPHGGPDGGADIDAVFAPDLKAVGAVGFMVGANDSDEQKKATKRKFESDVKSAMSAEEKPSAFVFFTNINLTMGEKSGYRDFAIKAGLSQCEIYDRERIRIALDSVDGFAARMQYLDIPLTEAEQQSFFAKWGADIQSVIATGFMRVEQTLNRLMFLQESNGTLSGMSVIYELDREYDASELQHYRAFCQLILKEPKHDIFQVFFGSADGSARFGEAGTTSSQFKSGSVNGTSGVQYERHIDLVGLVAGKPISKPKTEQEKWTLAGYSSGVGAARLKVIRARYGHSGNLMEFRPRLQLRDLDGAHFVHLLSKSLAGKVACIHILANGYKLAEFKREDFLIDPAPLKGELPVSFSGDELKDSWIRIRGKQGSIQQFDFFELTPRRLISAAEVDLGSLA